MFNNIDSQQREILLPENIRALNAYLNEEFRLLDLAVWSPLEKKHSSLNYVANEFRKGIDAKSSIQKVNNDVEQLQVLKPMAFIMDAFNEQIPGSTYENTGLKGILDLAQEFLPIQKKYFLSLAKTMNLVSKHANVDVEKLVKNQMLVDIVLKNVFDERNPAVNYLKKSQDYELGLLILTQKLLAYSEDREGVSIESMSARQKLPDVVAVKDLHKGIWNYKMCEFDRIYSK